MPEVSEQTIIDMVDSVNELKDAIAFKRTVLNEKADEVSDKASLVAEQSSAVAEQHSDVMEVGALVPSVLAAADRAEVFGPRTLNIYSDIASDTAMTPLNTSAGDIADVLRSGLFEVVNSETDYTVENSAGVLFSPMPRHGEVAAAQFGVVGLPIGSSLVVDESASIQKAIDFSSANKLRLVFESGRQYCVSRVIWRDHMSISTSSVAEFRPANTTDPMFILDRGPVRYVEIENLTWRGYGNDQYAAYLEARAKSVVPVGEPAHGGLWWATFRRITVRGFSGKNVWMRGGSIGSATDPLAPYNYLRPHQFISFVDCDIERSAMTDTACLLMTGQVEHVRFNGRNRVDGSPSAVGDQTALKGVGVHISREFVNGSIYGGASVGGSPVSDIAPTSILLNGMSAQKSENAYWIDRANGVDIWGNYFENLKRCIRLTGTCRVDISGNRFANAGSDGAGTGCLIDVGSGCFASGSGNNIAGVADAFIIANAGANYISDRLFVSLPDSTVGKYSGVTLGVTPTNSTINTASRYSTLVYGQPTPIDNISTGLPAGAMFAIRAWGQLIIVSGGNIGRVPNGRVVLRQGDSLILQRQDLSGTGEVSIVAISRNMSSPSMPTTGYYETGEEISKSGFTPSVNGPYVKGWLRLTTGTGHVLGTDWRQIIVTSGVGRATAIGSTAANLYNVTNTSGNLADSHMVIVNGADDTNSMRSFTDIILLHGSAPPVVVSSSGLNAPANRTYTVADSFMKISMATGSYSARAAAVSLPTGYINYNWN